MHIIVVGAGIIGSTLAFRLARQGAKVTVIDHRRPGAGTSTATFAYLNALRFSDSFAALRVEALAEWRDLAAEIGAENFVHRDGSVFYTDTDADAAELERHITASSAQGLRYEWMEAQRFVALHEPDLTFPDTNHPVLRLMDEGRIEPAPVLARLLAMAARYGADMYAGEKVESFDIGGNRIKVRVGHRLLEGDRVVICAGHQSPQLFSQLGIELPIRAQPGVTAVSKPLPTSLRHVVYAGQVHFMPDGGGRILAGKTDYRQAMPSRDEALEQARKTLSLVRPWLRGFGEDEFEAFRIGIRPIPADGLPMIGWLPAIPNVYTAVMHSGISLSALVAKLAAAEIIEGTVIARLDRYRPSRFGQAATVLKNDFAPWAPGDEIRPRPESHGEPTFTRAS